MTYLQGLRDVDPHRQVLIVDKEGGGANASEATSRRGVRLLQADITHRRTRLALRLNRAAGVVVMTRDDLLNLEAAWDLLDDFPNLRVIVHVADIEMRRRLGRLVDEGETRVRAFNSHRIAARRLWTDSLRQRFEQTAEEDAMVIAGFGRFGQTIAEYLREKAGEGLGRVVVVDHHATLALERFTEHIGGGWHDPRFVPVDGDLDDPRTWEAVDAALGPLDAPPAYVLGVDDDRTNLRGAARVRSEHPDAAVFVRCFHESRFTDEMAAEYNFEVLSLERLLREAFREEHLDWFGTRR
jgi:Trk K+ transport system NAD-binding subunit